MPNNIKCYRVPDESEENIKNKKEEYELLGGNFEYYYGKEYLLVNEEKIVSIYINGTEKSEEEILEIIYSKIFKSM